MNRFAQRWIFLCAICVLCPIFGASCGGSDNSDDDATPEDDDSAVDDDSSADDDTIDDDADDDTAADDDSADDDTVDPDACWTDLPVGEKAVFVEGLPGSEGIDFNSLGDMYISTGTQVAKVNPDGTIEPIADFTKPVGVAFDADDNLWVAEFGASALPGVGDGSVYMIPPGGSKTLVAEGIENPNFLVFTPNGSMLVSDNMAAEIAEVTSAGQVASWTDSIPSPNGMVYSKDRKTLYVANTFTPASPLYRVTLDDSGDPVSADIIANLDSLSLPDGIAMDENGILYVAENLAGEIVRVNPDDGTFETVASGLTTPASLAFGTAGKFDPCSIYVTELYSSKLWRISLGVKGYPLVSREKKLTR